MSKSHSPINVTEYLKRIECPIEIQATPAYLKKLHRQHLYHIPFENLDNFLGNQIILDFKRIYEKVILKKRGGFCYELNGLFYYLLKALGFEVRIISARVFNKDGDLGPEFDHMALLVPFENETYLVDVGFGISFVNPILLKPGSLQMDFNRYFKIDKDIDDIYTMNSSYDGQNFKPEYTFTDHERKMVEFIDMCEYHNRNKASHLTKTRVVSKPNNKGYFYLTDRLLTVYQNGKLEEFNILNFDEFKVKLFEYFHIH